MSELVWVAIPNGLVPDPDGGAPSQAIVRVLVVPRLTGVDIGEDGLTDWPSLAAEASLTLWTKTSAGIRTAARRPRYLHRARSEVWTGFFGGDASRVTPFEARTNPVPTVRPSYRQARDVAQTYRSVSRLAAVPANDSQAGIRSALVDWAAPEPERPPPPPGPAAFDSPDFHATVARLREHPTVMLDLGLVFEAVLDVAELAVGSANAARYLSVRCDDPPLLAGLVTAPWTRYDLDLTPPTTGFWPAAGSASGIRSGLLDLSEATSVTSPDAPADATRWAVTTFDVDGALGQLRQTGREVAADPGARAVMPPVRSAGLALLRRDRESEYAERVESARGRVAQGMADADLAAEDLVLGYRVDVRRESGPWLSLCERDADYTIGDEPIGPRDEVSGRVREEGHVKGFAAIKDADGGLHTDEVVVRWGGWSLAVPLPNLRGDTPGAVPDPAAPLPYRFNQDFAVPLGRLPELRFSNRYRMRVRVADLAGGGLELDDVAGNQGASASVIYRRHDPIQPPTLSGTEPFGPGAAVDRMVVRSDENLTPEQLHALDPSYPVVETRTLQPPTTSLQIAEQHGAFDTLSDEQSFALAQRAMQAEGPGLPDPAADGVNATVLAEPGGLDRELSDDERWSPASPDGQLQPKSIELRAHPTQPEPLTMAWSANKLKVTLGPAEQATIEISSTIPGDMADHLAVTDYLMNPPVSPEQTLLGRNVIVTPPRRVLVVHAVRRPLAEPRWSLPAAAIDRGPGATDGVLNPVFTAASSGLGLDTDSTGRLDVSATWTEVEDVGENATFGQREVLLDHVHTQAIGRGEPPRVRIRHEFGDTKYRRVTYSVKATSRFRAYFKDSDPEDAFQRSHRQEPVELMSTVRPAAPDVLAVMPAFTWQRSRPGADRIEHTRLSQRLRVELGRPWFQTGAGEQLAVVLASNDADAMAASELVTRMGRDPLFATPGTPPRPPAAWFALHDAVRQAVASETGAPVTLVPVDVTPAGDRWLADVELTVPVGAASYNPLVRLAVARYQPHSLDGLQLSPIVVTDTVPLLPDRRVVLTRTGSQIDITVAGVAPHPPNTLEVILETCEPGIDPDELDIVVDDAAADAELSAWRPVPGGVVRREPNGSIPPLRLTPTPGRLRVRLRETENLPGVDTTSSPDVRRRSVFVDTIVLPQEWGSA